MSSLLFTEKPKYRQPIKGLCFTYYGNEWGSTFNQKSKLGRYLIVNLIMGRKSHMHHCPMLLINDNYSSPCGDIVSQTFSISMTRLPYTTSLLALFTKLVNVNTVLFFPSLYIFHCRISVLRILYFYQKWIINIVCLWGIKSLQKLFCHGGTQYDYWYFPKKCGNWLKQTLSWTRAHHLNLSTQENAVLK